MPEDFIVEEIYDLKRFEEKDEGKDYFYFKLKKTNYDTLRALDKIAKIFHVSKKMVHFAGTKDKVGITTQIISIVGLKEDNFFNNVDFINNNVDDIEIEYIGKYSGRINLGDNLGNRFMIVARDLREEEVSIAEENCKKIEENGVLNFFDEQRFGYAGNSHIVGKYAIKGDMEMAVYEILSSTPPNPSDDLKNFIDFVKDNWEKIKEQDEEAIQKAIELTPGFLKSEAQMIEHLGKYKNDFYGAFRKVHKKLRTLYINAYQSYVFNETIMIKNDVDELELVNPDFDLTTETGKITEQILSKDDITLEDLKLKSMPEIKLTDIRRKVKVFPKNLEIVETGDDELNEGKKKMKVSFELGPGEYATNVVKQLFITQ